MGRAPAALLCGLLLALAPATQAAEQDRDHDGIADDLDRCPDRPGPAANLGCPDRDQDNDGIVDRLDACPSVAGPASNHGCPGEAPPPPPPAQPGVAPAPGAPSAPAPAEDGTVQLKGKRLVFAEPVSFEVARDVLTPQGQKAVEAAARVLVAHPELRRLVIEGHVDEPNNTAAKARDLSRRRADAVKKVLVEKGVSADRLRAQGFGYSRLIDRSETPAAAKVNNRIEIVAQD